MDEEKLTNDITLKQVSVDSQSPLSEPPTFSRRPKLIFAIIIFTFTILILGLLFYRKTSQTKPSPIPIQEMDQAQTPEAYPLYLGTYQEGEVLFISSNQGQEADQLGDLITSDGTNYNSFDFQKIVNPKKIYTDNSKSIFSINNFKLNNVKNSIYVSLNYSIEGQPYPNLLNKILQINLKTLAVSEIWSNNLDSGKYPNLRGAVYLDQIIEDKYLSLIIYNCYACSGSPAGVIALNINSGGEKYYEQAGDLQFDLPNNSLTYKKFARVEESCVDGEGCENGVMGVNKPVGSADTDALP